MSKAWIGVDLDGTLATYEPDSGTWEIGKPIAPMVQRIKDWLSQGFTVKIMTARYSEAVDPAVTAKIIQRWLEQQGLPPLEVTATKDFGMMQLWDDRAVQVVPNTGEPVGDLY
jgi:hydroxymethylpyrimidine pyrophosphatase-like HAD family hydrolase